MSNVFHQLFSCSIYGLNTSILFVVEYDTMDDQLYPKNVYPVSQYDEMEDTITNTFDNFPKLNDLDLTNYDDSFDQFLFITEKMKELYYQNLNVESCEIHGGDIAEEINKNFDLKLDYLEVDLPHLISFIETSFHKFFIKEQNAENMYYSSYKNPLCKIVWDNIIKERTSIEDKTKQNKMKPVLKLD